MWDPDHKDPKIRYPFYQAERERKWGKDPKKVVKKILETSQVPYWLPPQSSKDTLLCFWRSFSQGATDNPYCSSMFRAIFSLLASLGVTLAWSPLQAFPIPLLQHL